MDLSALSGVRGKLKPTRTVVKTLAQVNEECGSSECDERSSVVMKKRDYVMSWVDVNIENWLNLLNIETGTKLTFETELVTVSKLEATAFVDMEVLRKRPCETNRDAQYTKIRNRLSRIENAVDASIIRFGGEAFVKTSSRSPKDAVEANGKLAAMLSIIPKLNCAPPSPGNPEAKQEYLRLINAHASSILDSAFKSMKVTSGKEALDLLINSQRVCEDMSESLDIASVFQQSVVIRKWYRDLRWEMEVRAFVRSGEIVAMSQYCHVLCVAPLVQLRFKIQSAILEFWATRCRPQLAAQFPNCVVDFGFVDSAAAITATNCANCSVGDLVASLVVIEINPWHQTTDPCLFKWAPPPPHQPATADTPADRLLPTLVSGVDTTEDSSSATAPSLRVLFEPEVSRLIPVVSRFESFFPSGTLDALKRF
ncbi:cell division cycle protein 123-like [Pelomyxa schiedti]|nr:cell division cycle protein 123-like [Pelomyxa schiedti]